MAKQQQKLLSLLKRNSIFLILLFLLFEKKIFSLEINGNFIQGGLIQGNVDHKAQVYLNENLIPIDKDGNFLFGFERKNKSSAKIKITLDNEIILNKFFKIEQREYLVQKITIPDKKKVTPPKEFYERIKAETELIRKAKKVKVKTPYYKKGFIMPTKGIITGVYGSQRIFNGIPKRPHYGLDIANKMGTDIIATCDGEIVLTQNDLFFSGGTIIISHGQGLTSSYLHLSSILVKVGDIVRQGQIIAKMGDTGRATGSHLDWRMEIRGVRIDPKLLLN